MTLKQLRVLSVTPVHAGGQRDPGDESHVRIVIDLGLKNGQLGEVVMDEEEAVQFSGEMAISTARVANANRSYRRNDAAEKADWMRRPHNERGCITVEAHDDDGCTFPANSRPGKLMKIGG